jgi:hypothetical protein
VTSPVGRRLTEVHRQTQLRIGRLTVVQAHSLFPLLDPKDVDGTFHRWFDAVHRLVQAHRIASARAAASYYTTLRNLEVPDAPGYVPKAAPLLNRQRLAVSLLVTGAISIKNNTARAVNLTKAADIADARSAGESMRYALEGGRDTITESTAADPAAVGWQRVASANACDFCTELADQGFTGGEDAVSFPAHGLCSCTAEPAFG